MRRLSFWMHLTLLAALVIPVAGCVHRYGYYDHQGIFHDHDRDRDRLRDHEHDH